MIREDKGHNTYPRSFCWGRTCTAWNGLVCVAHGQHTYPSSFSCLSSATAAGLDPERGCAEHALKPSHDFCSASGTAGSLVTPKSGEGIIATLQ